MRFVRVASVMAIGDSESDITPASQNDGTLYDNVSKFERIGSSLKTSKQIEREIKGIGGFIRKNELDNAIPADPQLPTRAIGVLPARSDDIMMVEAAAGLWIYHRVPPRV
jgi:hypothetical protein